MKTAQAIFSGVLTYLRQHMSESELALWFSGIVVLNISQEKIVLGAPSLYYKNEIEKKYNDVLIQALKEVAHVDTYEIILGDFDDEDYSSHIVSTTSTKDTIKKNVKNASNQIAPHRDSQQHSRTQTKNIRHAQVAQTTQAMQTQREVQRQTQVQTLFSFNRRFTFDSFVVGESNQFAASVAKAISDNPGDAYNPTLIYGNVGLGKTHLLHAIGNEVSRVQPHLNVIYKTTEDFVNEFVFSLRKQKTGEFKNKFRTVDVLLLDDIQFLSGKAQTQDELFHTFNVLEHSGSQMVFASDRSIMMIKDLEERLASRFHSGISVDLQPPSPELASGILHNALDRKQPDVTIPETVLDFISTNMRTNIRDMLGFLNRVIGYSQLTGKTVDIPTLQQWIYAVAPHSNQMGLDDKRVLQIVANHFSIDVVDLKSKKRSRKIARARHIAIYLLRTYLQATFTEIGRMFNISHTSCIRAVHNVQDELRLGKPTTQEVERIKSLMS